jgi:hypothetical protein
MSNLGSKITTAESSGFGAELKFGGGRGVESGLREKGKLGQVGFFLVLEDPLERRLDGLVGRKIDA